MYSTKCGSTAYWDLESYRCIECNSVFSPKSGYEFNTNCGMDDDGGEHGPVYRLCKSDTFNNGTFYSCQKCSVCPRLELTVAECNSSSDTRCCAEGGGNQDVECNILPTTGSTVEMKTSIIFDELTHGFNCKAANAGIVAGLVILVVSLVIYYVIKKRRGSLCHFGGKGRSHLHSEQEPAIPQPDVINLDEYLTPEVQVAPLKAVLDNLDVLEELIILLDPNCSVRAVKNTRNLAALCSYPSSWINYAYSMRNSKSPLVALLEGVVSKHPDWTVGYLARLLIEIRRTDAVAALNKLPVSNETV